jgi:pimeloyl-ACP methyl ester carboxylesterase
MDKAVLDGTTLEYEVSGTGEPVVFIHGALIAEAFRPLLTEPSLERGYKLVIYHRRGYRGSRHASGSVSLIQQAADCRALLRHLGIERAHVVGHSFGGSIGIQLALDAPDVVHSLALLESALFGRATGQTYRESLARGEQRYREVPADVVVDEFLRMRFGSGYRAALERVLPGAFEQAVADSRATFEADLPALRAWRFDEEELQRITQPVLNLLGSESEALWPRFGEVYQLVLDWLPQARGFVVPGAAHGLMMQNPGGVAGALANFWQRQPIAASSRGESGQW